MASPTPERPSSISPLTLRQLCDKAFSVFDQSELHKVLRSYQPNANITVDRQVLDFSQAHSLALTHERVYDAVSRLEADGVLNFNDPNLLLIHILNQISNFSDEKKAQRILKRMLSDKSITSMQSCLWEATVFCQYSSLFEDVSLIDEDNDTGKFPDIRITTANGAVFVECKHLEDFDDKQGHIGGRIANLMIKKLREIQPGWELEFEAKRLLTARDDVEPAVQAAIQFITRGEIGSTEICDGAFLITSKQLAERDVWVHAPFPEPKPRKPREAIRRYVDGPRSADGNIYPYRNPNIVRTSVFCGYSDWTRIEENLSKARRQIPDNATGITYIQLPYNEPDRFEAMIDSVWDKIFNKLRNQPEVNAVILTGLYLYLTSDGELTVQERSTIIPNPNPAQQLPIDFRIPHLENRINLDRTISTEGEIIFQFILDHPLPQEPGKTVFFACSRDGSSQIKAWQSFQNLLRFDFVGRSFGKYTFEADLNDLQAGVRHQIAANYSATEMNISCDGVSRGNVYRKR